MVTDANGVVTQFAQSGIIPITAAWGWAPPGRRPAFPTTGGEALCRSTRSATSSSSSRRSPDS